MPKKQKKFNKYLILGILIAIVIVVIFLLFFFPKKAQIQEESSIKNISLTTANVTMIYDKKCTTCYYPEQHLFVLKKLGIKVTKIAKYNINETEAKEFIEKYNITAIPTIIVSPEAQKSENFTKVWQEVGTRESDGYFVFRNLRTLKGATYLNLTNGMLYKNN